VPLAGTVLTIYAPAGSAIGVELYAQVQRPAGNAIGGVAWTPALLPALAAWYDASVASSITQVANKVSQWNDLSGNARHMTQAVGANQPLTNTALINGLNAIRFGAATNINMATGAVAIAQPLTMFAIVKGNTDLARHDMLTGGASNPGIYVNLGAPNWQMFAGVTADSAIAFDLTLHLVTFVYNGAASAVRVDGTLVGALNPGANGVASLTFGLSPQKADMDLAEAGWTSAALGAADYASLRTYAQTKWGTP
jgi:hypothetical protein